MSKVRTLDFCTVQRIINAWGGSNEHRAFIAHPVWRGDRLSQYGFGDLFQVPPECPGVYAVVIAKPIEKAFDIDNEHLLYIGSSSNMRRRVRDTNHLLRRIALRPNIHDFTYVRFLETDDYLSIERSLIKTLRPPFNTIYNNG